MRLYRQLALIILASLTVSCGHEQVQIPDFEYCGYLGPAGGPDDACSCVHTLFTDVPPKHYPLNTCFQKLEGAVFFQGKYMNTMQANLDKLCAQGGNCTYEQEQALKTVQTMLKGMARVIPHKEAHR